MQNPSLGLQKFAHSQHGVLDRGFCWMGLALWLSIRHTTTLQAREDLHLIISVTHRLYSTPYVCSMRNMRSRKPHSIWTSTHADRPITLFRGSRVMRRHCVLRRKLNVRCQRKRTEGNNDTAVGAGHAGMSSPCDLKSLR